MNVSAKASNCDRLTVVSGYFSSLLTAHCSLGTFHPILPFSPPSSLRHSLRRGYEGQEGFYRQAGPANGRSAASRKKQIPSSGDMDYANCIGVDERVRVKLSRKAAMAVRGIEAAAELNKAD